MIKNYLISTIRNLLKNKIYAFINILGLAVGITFCLLITFYVKNELSYDQFHVHKDHIYRVNLYQVSDAGNNRTVGLTSEHVGPALEDKYPEIKDHIKIRPFGGWVVYADEDIKLESEYVMLAEPEFFDYFNFKLIHGDPSNVLSDPSSIVLSEKFSKALFGEQNPVGQTITLAGPFKIDLRVSGVAENPDNSHLNYEIIIPWDMSHPEIGRISDWYRLSLYTYIRMDENADINAFKDKIENIFKELYGEDGENLFPRLQQLDEIYLTSDDIQFAGNFDSGNKQNLHIVSFIALFILLIGCVNYININTSKATKRAREVGMRKVLGASKRQLIIQFLGESLVITLITSAIAILLADILLPWFNQLVGADVSIPYNQIWLWGFIAVIILIVSLLSGIYPAFILSAFKPSTVLKTSAKSGLSGNIPRKVLIVFQFVISLILLSATIIILRQTQYLLDKELGFNKDQVLVIPVNNSNYLSYGTNYETFMQEVKQIPSVQNISIGTDALGTGFTNNSGGVYPEGNEEEVLTTIFYVDMNFIDTYDMEIIQGRDFNPQLASDSTSLIVNETFVKKAGWENPIGKRVKSYRDGEGSPVIGVVKDFNFQALHQEVNPVIIGVLKRNYWKLSVKISTENIPQTLEQLESTWKKFEQDYPFEYYFVDQKFADFYNAEFRLLSAISVFSVISILIACLGLYGLTSFTIEQKIKEIGIRKVFGAELSNITFLVNKQFLQLLLISIILSVPVSWYFINQWLENFAYQVTIPIWIFIASGGITFLITTITVSYQSLKAALIDPVKVIKYE